MDEKIRILHLWNDEKEAERVIGALAASGLDFEAKLVRSEYEYISDLIKRTFNIIIADDRADFHRPGTGELSAYEIALEIAPGVPFLLISSERRHADPMPMDSGTPSFCVPRHELHRLGPVIRKACNLSFFD